MCLFTLLFINLLYSCLLLHLLYIKKITNFGTESKYEFPYGLVSREYPNFLHAHYKRILSRAGNVLTV